MVSGPRLELLLTLQAPGGLGAGLETLGGQGAAAVHAVAVRAVLNALERVLDSGPLLLRRVRQRIRPVRVGEVGRGIGRMLIVVRQLVAAAPAFFAQRAGGTIQLGEQVLQLLTGALGIHGSLLTETSVRDLTTKSRGLAPQGMPCAQARRSPRKLPSEGGFTSHFGALRRGERLLGCHIGYKWSMALVRTLARPLLSAVFVASGVEQLRQPEPQAARAAPVGDLISRSVPYAPKDTETLVRINGGVQLAAGTLLALGRFPRLSALVLAGTLVPATAGGHRFWEESEPARRSEHQKHFLKNAGLFGGLLFAAVAGRKPKKRTGRSKDAGTKSDRSKRAASKGSSAT